MIYYTLILTISQCIFAADTIIWKFITHIGRSNYTRGDQMEHNRFLRGIGIGMLAGAMVGMMVSPGKKELKQTANKAVQAVGNAADTISEAIKN